MTGRSANGTSLILIVEDEPSIAELVGLYLRRAGYEVSVVGDGRAALDEIERRPPDLVILDLMLPKLDGYGVMRRLREKGEIPVIMLTARRNEADRIAGLEMGADDYVVKPFSAQELVSRVRAVLRRAAGHAGDDGGRLEYDGLVIDPGARTVLVHGEERDLAAKEFDLLLRSGPPSAHRPQPGPAPRARVGVGRLHRPQHRHGAREAGPRKGRRGSLRAPLHQDRVGRRVPVRAVNGVVETVPDTRPRRLWLFVAGVFTAVLVALLVFSLLLRPPRSDFFAMSAFLSITALASVTAGAIAYRLGWMRRSPRLIWMLMGGYLLAAALTFANVLVTARLMFLNQHDLQLSLVLLVFAAIIAASLGYLLSSSVASAVARLNRAVGQVAKGDLEAKAPIEGPAEVAALAANFNQMTAQLREAEQRRAEVEAARRDLLTAVGHDLRTPLASVRIIMEALSDGVVDEPETAARYLRVANSELTVLSHLVDDLFMLAQLDAGGVELERSPNSMTDLISDTLESFSVKAEQQGVTLRGEPCQEADGVAFDARYIGRALANLVENALRYTPRGGEVVLRTDVRPEGVSVSVSDTGPGIAPEDAPRVFDRFYRGEASRNRATGGSGLGLAIVRSVVEAHGGRVGVRSAIGQGTIVSFILPV